MCSVCAYYKRHPEFKIPDGWSDYEIEIVLENENLESELVDIGDGLTGSKMLKK